MSKSNTFENDTLALYFNGTAIANIADNASSSPLTSLYVALHTADPGEGGTSATSEATYTNYARVAVTRNSGGWTVSGNTVTNTAQITFPQCGASGNTITHVSITTASSGSSKYLYAGSLNSPLDVALNITPLFAANGLTITED